MFHRGKNGVLTLGCFCDFFRWQTANHLRSNRYVSKPVVEWWVKALLLQMHSRGQNNREIYGLVATVFTSNSPVTNTPIRSNRMIMIWTRVCCCISIIFNIARGITRQVHSVLEQFRPMEPV